MKNILRCWIFALCVLLAFLPASAKKKKASSPQEPPEIVWPAPPAKPVIRFVGSYWGDVNFPPSKKGRFRQKLLGEKPPDRRIHRPFDVAVDSVRQRIYVSDYAYIGVFDVANKAYAEFRGEPPYALQYVTGLWVDGGGHLYAVDARAKRVCVFDSDLRPVRAYEAPGKMEHAVDVAVNDETGRVYVSDSQNNAVHVFSKEDAEYLSSFGAHGSGDGQLYKPSYLWVDAAGLVYVTDFFNFRVQAFGAEGEFLFKIGSMGVKAGQFSKPKGVAVDAEGHIYVADSAFGNIQVFDRSGQLLLVFSNHGWRDGEMRLPAGLWIDGGGHIYAADSVNGRVCEFEFLGAPEVDEAEAP